jgi:endonuclease/exonuclease/phosphatase family metal-dependent hydrolase
LFAQALGRLEDKAPDILALIEVENAQILEELAGGLLSKQGYKWTFFANNPGSSLGVGVLSRFPLTHAKAHSLNSEGAAVPRPVLEVWVQPNDTPLALFICHWKSKLGGDAATEPLRRSAARIIVRRLREIQAENPGTPVIIMGDLNENHDEFYRRAGEEISALLPDDPKAAELSLAPAGALSEAPLASQTDFLVLSRKKPPEAANFPADVTSLYSPWGNELADGSYYYKNAWETIDHFLLNAALFDGSGWDFEGCKVVNQEPFTTSKGYPHAYNPRTGSGLSDHLPLLLTLRLQDPGK